MHVPINSLIMRRLGVRGFDALQLATVATRLASVKWAVRVPVSEGRYVACGKCLLSRQKGFGRNTFHPSLISVSDNALAG
jgi:hypothetical protein